MQSPVIIAPFFGLAGSKFQMAYQHIKVPSGGEKIRVRKDFSLEVPERPIIPYIEGDGTGVDITPVMLRVVDAAVQKAYGGAKKIIWMEMFAGEKSCRVYGENVWLPDETLQASKDFVVSIKGPLTTPVGGGIRRAYQYAIDNKRKSVTLVHKGNIQKFTEGGFRDWGYKLAQKEFDAKPIDGGPWHSFKNPKGGPDIVVKDVITDAMLQQILLRPAEYDVLATTNLNGDYISDALAAEVGGIGIAPGANLSDTVAMFEATHGTAPKYAGKDYVNPGSEILSAEMMLRHMGWPEAADAILRSIEKTISEKIVTYDFARLMQGAKQVSCSGFGQAMIERM